MNWRVRLGALELSAWQLHCQGLPVVKGCLCCYNEGRKASRGSGMEVILTHENTDFDGLASLLAAAKLYPDAIPVLPRALNRNLQDFLALYRDEFPFVKAEDLPRRRIERVILVDTQTVPSLKGLRRKAEIRIIDHHPLARELGRRVSYYGEEIGATTTILVEQISEAHIPLSPLEATLLLLGIYEDTGCLSYLSTTPRDIRCAAWLLEQGANLSVVNDFLRHPLSERQRELYNQLVENTEFHHFAGQLVIIATAKVTDYAEEIAILAHKLRDLFNPAAAFILVDLEDRIHLVARSSTHAINVAEIARHFGGGGHNSAAAAMIRGLNLREVRRRLLDMLATHVKPIATVRQIMSYGVHTLPPEATVAEAAEMMRRYGHEGFPVVREGKLLGILTRREIDKALHHGLHEMPIESYMHKGEISVSPDDSIERLQQVMMEHDIGQIPVVEDGAIVGIVTRTDLIKLWAAPRHPRAEEIARAMAQALPPSLLNLLKEASQTASEMDFHLYVVGGFVRDLLLGVPNLDLDLVVEGDAIALAKRLAEKVGGRVHSHRRFGTAKLIIGPKPKIQGQAGRDLEPRTSELGLTLDLATARMEFYEHPTALPEVERSSIKQDLHRRDFTINTLAICLDPDRYGELLDFYGGERDLKNGLIRVLHSLSFVEDPTRMLRAVRLEQRLGFRIEERTEELLRNALDLLDRVSGDRIRNELYLILREEEPEKALRRLEELGVLTQIHPSLRCDDWVVERFRRLRKSLGAGDWRLYLALLTLRLTREELEELIARLNLARDEAKVLYQVNELRSLLPKLEERQRPSTIYRMLKPFSEEAISAHQVATDAPLVREQLDLYRRRLRYLKPEIDGNYLKGMGLKPGPIFGRILDALRDARLDGEVTTLEEEKELVRKLLAGG